MDFEQIKIFLSGLSLVDSLTIIATLTAILAAVSAFYSYRLSKQIYDEIKSDETILASRVQHPDLKEYDHSKCVLYFTLLNKSQRKASITSIRVLDRQGKEIDVNWSDSIDSLGNIQSPTGLIALKDSTEIFLRRNDGKSFFIVNIIIKHSFSDEELVIKYEP